MKHLRFTFELISQCQLTNLRQAVINMAAPDWFGLIKNKFSFIFFNDHFQIVLIYNLRFIILHINFP